MQARPCPHSVQWDGTAAIIGRALTMISRGEADEISFEKFAAKLGVSDRHLRRLFEEHVGASPIDVATSKRLHLARHLLSQSSLPVTQVAFASGYKSIRRFNDAFKQKFRTPPSHLRRPSNFNLIKDLNFIRVELPVIMPFDWGLLFRFLESHKIQGVESFVNGRYRRSFSLKEAIGAVEIGFEPRKKQLSVMISISNLAYLRVAIEKVRDLLDTRANPHGHLHNLDTRSPVTKCYHGTLKFVFLERGIPLKPRFVLFSVSS